MAGKSVPPHAGNQDAAIAPTAGGRRRRARLRGAARVPRCRDERMASAHVRVRLECCATSDKSVRRRFIVDHVHGRRTRSWLECSGTGGDRGTVWDAGAGGQGQCRTCRSARPARGLSRRRCGRPRQYRASAARLRQPDRCSHCADVRGFTNFAEETAPEEVTRRLNGIFDCLGGPVRAAGGEILKFLGDGVLAVFLPPDGANVAVVTPAALAAAREILARVEALNATEAAAGNPALGLDIALHAGEVTYGNIGTADRLDFTVIGHAVNEAARLEGLCKVLGKQILISKSFAQSVREQLSSVGRHPLKGVREAQEVFTV